ncbi:carbohydrate ABC transporter permease [Promicromonospora vindobonensis]|uniref:Carbohydrate ABC transporter permease n=1 Tax=Promicromonospora vindobonensis TaxID=195748 RepID=A0ABW5VQB1_9MICO
MATTIERPGSTDRPAAPRPATARRSGETAGGRGVVGTLLLYAMLLILSVIILAPLLWMLSTSFKTTGDATALPPQWIPPTPTLEGYTKLFADAQAPLLRWLGNSVLVGVLHTALVLVTASMAAYPLARMRFPGRRVVFALIIATLFVPGFVFLMPNYLIVDGLGWLDSLWALVVPGAASAFGVFFLCQFFASIPAELEEAALIDGANRWQIFFRVVLPLSKAPLATLGLLSFLASWNDFLWPLYVLFNPSQLTLPAGLATLRGAYATDFPAVMAGAAIASIPVLILFAFVQRFVIAGVARSGLKG